MIDRCFSCQRVPILMPANITHTHGNACATVARRLTVPGTRKAPWTTGIPSSGWKRSWKRRKHDMARYRTIRKHSEETGFTESAIRTKIHRGVWLEGRVWKRAPDGTIMIDEEGYNQWVENGNGLAMNRNALESSPFRKHRSRSVSRSEESIAANESSSSPLPLP